MQCASTDIKAHVLVHILLVAIYHWSLEQHHHLLCVFFAFFAFFLLFVLPRLPCYKVFLFSLLPNGVSALSFKSDWFLHETNQESKYAVSWEKKNLMPKYTGKKCLALAVIKSDSMTLTGIYFIYDFIKKSSFFIQLFYRARSFMYFALRRCKNRKSNTVCGIAWRSWGLYMLCATSIGDIFKPVTWMTICFVKHRDQKMTGTLTRCHHYRFLYRWQWSLTARVLQISNFLLSSSKNFVQCGTLLMAKCSTQWTRQHYRHANLFFLCFTQQWWNHLPCIELLGNE